MHKEKIVISPNEVPDSYSIHQWIETKYRLCEKYKCLKPKNNPSPYLRFTIHNFERERLLSEVKESFIKHGKWGYLSHFKDTNSTITDRTPYYGGLSLTHNPSLSYTVPEVASALGEPKLNLHDLFLTDLGKSIWIKIEEQGLTSRFYYECFSGGLPAARLFLLKHGIISGNEDFNWDRPFTPLNKNKKGSYFDSFGFIKPTQVAKFGYLGEFIKDRITRQMIRSRIACISGDQHQLDYADYMWHVDEPIFYNLRLNIPLQTSSDFLLEIKDLYKGPLDHNSGFTWNTEKLHRVYSTKKINFERIHLIFGISPWFDFIEDEGIYQSNEYLGEVHPFDMLALGLVIQGVTVEGN
jgi:hypothetical protein